MESEQIPNLKVINSGLDTTKAFRYRIPPDKDGQNKHDGVDDIAVAHVLIERWR